MGILRRNHQEFTLSRAGVKHRSLLEQPDVYFYGALKFRINGKYKNCLAMLRPSYISLRDRKRLDTIVATIRFDKGIKFHTDEPNTSNKTTAPSQANGQMVKFELHVTTAPGHGRSAVQEEEEACCTKYEFKCKSLDVRNLWKAYILALSEGIRPNECNVHLLPGQVMQIERMLEMENKRRTTQRSLTSTPRLSSSSSDNHSVSANHRSQTEKLPAHKSKSLHSTVVATASSGSTHKFYKDGGRGTPSYYFERISREMAEAILTMGHMYGNLLMRRSTSYPNSYALSFRSTLNHNTEIFHYEIGPFRKHNSVELYFEIKMEGRHPKFKCLNDVVRYFVKLTDGLAHGFTTNNLEKLGIKQPPYSTHYEPPADYEEEYRASAVTAPLSPVLPLPPPPLPSSQDDPNSEEITPIADQTTEDEEEKDKIVQFIEPISRAIQPSSPKEPQPQRSISVQRTPSKTSISPKTSDPITATPFQRRDSATPIRKESIPKTDHARISPVSKTLSSATDSSSASAGSPVNIKPHNSVTFNVPPPPPPPLMLNNHAPLTRNVTNGANLKPVLKAQPDRKQFAPERNLFRIALEYEEPPVAVADECDVITEPNELANQLKGNVKSRVANLETDPDRKAVPNYSRPPKKDFMGELAEKLKIRRQVVEQTCW